MLRKLIDSWNVDRTAHYKTIPWVIFFFVFMVAFVAGMKYAPIMLLAAILVFSVSFIFGALYLIIFSYFKLE